MTPATIEAVVHQAAEYWTGINNRSEYLLILWCTSNVWLFKSLVSINGQRRKCVYVCVYSERRYMWEKENKKFTNETHSPCWTVRMHNWGSPTHHVWTSRYSTSPPTDTSPAEQRAEITVREGFASQHCSVFVEIHSHCHSPWGTLPL